MLADCGVVDKLSRELYQKQLKNRSYIVLSVIVNSSNMVYVDKFQIINSIMVIIKNLLKLLEDVFILNQNSQNNFNGFYSSLFIKFVE